MATANHVPNLPQIRDEDVTDPELAAVIEAAATTKSPPQSWYRTMGNNPDVAKEFARYWDMLHRGGTVDHSIKELARLQIAQMIGCEFCARQISPLAQVTDEEKASCAMPHWDHPDPKTRAALHYAFKAAEIVELSAFFCLTAGGNRMAKSWGIEPHEEVSAIPAGAFSIHGAR